MNYPYRDPETGKFAHAIVRNLPKDCDLIQIDHANAEMRLTTTTDYDTFFVIVGDSDFLAIWGMYGIVPYLTKPVYRIV